jgi:hypothetical protein
MKKKNKWQIFISTDIFFPYYDSSEILTVRNKTASKLDIDICEDVSKYLVQIYPSKVLDLKDQARPFSLDFFLWLKITQMMQIQWIMNHSTLIIYVILSYQRKTVARDYFDPKWCLVKQWSFQQTNQYIDKCTHMYVPIYVYIYA